MANLSQSWVNRKQDGPFYNKDVNSASWISPEDDEEKDPYKNPAIKRIEDGQNDTASLTSSAVSLGKNIVSSFGQEAVKSGAKEMATEAAKQAVKEGAKDTLSTSVSGAIPIIGGALGAYTLWDMNNSLDGAAAKLAYNPATGAVKGAAAGAGVGTMIMPGVGTAIGAVLGAAYGGFLKKLKTGKDKDQLRRDLIREQMVKGGFIDKEGKYTLANGTVFEMGKDGGFRYADGFHAYEVDHSDKLQGTVFGHALPIAEMITGSDDKLTSDFAGYLTRMALSNTSDLNAALSNLKDAAVKAGASPDKLVKYVMGKTADGVISKEEAAAYVGGVGNIFADNRNLTLIGDAPNSKPIQSGLDSSKTVASRVVRKAMPERVKQVHRAVSSVIQAPVIPSYEEERKKAADMWGHDYSKRVSNIDFRKDAGWITSEP